VTAVLDMVNRSYTAEEGGNPRKPLRFILLDSALIGAIAMGASMPSTVPTWAEAWVLFKAFFIAFIYQLAVERGLKKPSPPE